MSEYSKLFDKEVGEVDLMDVLRKKKALHVSIPQNASHEETGAVLSLVANVAHCAQVESALRPLLDNMKFDLEAAERGALPPAKV